MNDIMAFSGTGEAARAEKSWLTAEIGRVAGKVSELKIDGDLTFALLTDSHYTVNGTWGDTVAALRGVCGLVGLDGVIHLGDLTDGMVTGYAAKVYANKALGDLRGCGAPVWLALGNHDSNYFRGNTERFTIDEQRELYFGGGEARYNVDFADRKLRLVFLDSFDFNEKNRYGYGAECVEWLKDTLYETADDWRVIVFSHLSPMARLQYWAKEIRGEGELMEVLRSYRGKILAFINGHNHADILDNEEGLPILSIANAKCEAFTEYKTDGFVTPERKLNDKTQECFDILSVNSRDKTLRFTRFGAGKDRVVKDGRAEFCD